MAGGNGKEGKVSPFLVLCVVYNRFGRHNARVERLLFLSIGVVCYRTPGTWYFFIRSRDCLCFGYFVGAAGAGHPTYTCGPFDWSRVLVLIKKNVRTS